VTVLYSVAELLTRDVESGQMLRFIERFGSAPPVVARLIFSLLVGNDAIFGTP